MPDAPTAVVTPTGTTASVSFTPGSDRGSPITSFRAECISPDGGDAGAKAGPSSPLVVKNLTPGHTYACRVPAANAVGKGKNSAYSDTFTTWTQQDQAPRRPPRPGARDDRP